MRRYLLDTNAVGDWINRRHGVDLRVREARGRGTVIGTCEPVVAELYFGIENSDTRDENAVRLQRAPASLKCWPLTREASREFGRIMATRKRAGTMIGPMDVLIAAIALTLPECAVVSKDTDLLHIPGLTVENWAETA
jgi:tRNA(fMet)-specific endonuclease VapC